VLKHKEQFKLKLNNYFVVVVFFHTRYNSSITMTQILELHLTKCGAPYKGKVSFKIFILLLLLCSNRFKEREYLCDVAEFKAM
jgi:hypothetical protein